MTEVLTLQLVGGPTAVIEYAGLRFLTDPTFDPPGEYTSRPGVALVKRTGPALGPEAVGAIDAVLLSHDHHFDNLDHAGRAFLATTPLALTTPSGAARLGDPARPLAPWETWELTSPDGRPVTVTAVPALHGPPGSEPVVGEVIGFYLTGPDLPTVYVSGDNASVPVVQDIVDRLGSAPIAILHAGAAQVADIPGEVLTLSADRAVAAARILGAERVIAVHFEGWAHFSEGAAALEATFAEAGLSAVLTIPEPGATVRVPWPDSPR